MYRSKKYLEWIGKCEEYFANRVPPLINYPFAIEIAMGRPSKRKMDIDNRIKAVLDVLERVRVIEDDSLAEHEANSEWEMAQLQDKDKILRWFSYTMFTAPIVITVISPEWGKQIFQNLEYAPSWVVEVWIAMNGAVWGLSSLKNVVPSVVGSIRKK